MDCRDPSQPPILDRSPLPPLCHQVTKLPGQLETETASHILGSQATKLLYEPSGLRMILREEFRQGFRDGFSDVYDDLARMIEESLEHVKSDDLNATMKIPPPTRRMSEPGASKYLSVNWASTVGTAGDSVPHTSSAPQVITEASQVITEASKASMISDADSDGPTVKCQVTTPKQRPSALELAAKGGMADKALGFSVTRADSRENSQNVITKGASFYQKLAERIVSNTRFEFFMLALIFANAASVGIQTNYMAMELLEDAPTSFRVLDILFCVFFSAELAIRLYAYRMSFFTMWGYLWNIFDLCLVAIQIIEELLLLVFDSNRKAMFSFVLRIVRVLRAIRILRVLMVMRYTEDLQLLVSCILHTMRTFIWASALLFIMTYVAAIYLTQLVLSHRLDDPTTVSAKLLDHFYGSVPISILSVFQALTGGVDWNDIVRPLIDYISPWLGFFAAIYVAFAMLAVMNIVTGTFVEISCSRAAEVKEICMVNQAKAFFKLIDTDDDGRITISELEGKMWKPEIQQHFKRLNVDITKGRMLFDVLDSDASGWVDLNEFLSGCLRLQGPARAWDLMLTARETRTTLKRHSRALDNLSSHLRDLRVAIRHSGYFGSCSYTRRDLETPVVSDLARTAPAPISTNLA